MTKRISIPYLVVVLVSLLSTVSAYAFKLPDTGQTKCYQGASPHAEIPCAGTGQDGEYSINPMNYTDNSDGTVTDNNTGLMWQKQDDGIRYNWYQASGTYDATYNASYKNVCATLNLGGYSDWRLPSKKDLVTILDYSIPYPSSEPTINPIFSNAKVWFYWASTPAAYYPNAAWFVDFEVGSTGNYYKDVTYYARCVRGEQSTQAFTDNGNGTVTDTMTGLMWQQGEPGVFMTWDGALSYCNGLSLAGHDDWRLPNIKELETITDDTIYDPIDPIAIDRNFFPNAVASYYWSSTTWEGINDGFAWGVYFVYGYNDSGRSKANAGSYNQPSVRCVRAGQSVSLGNLSISKTGAGSGTVVSSPVGINCGDTCSAYYPINNTVALIATPSVGGSIFSEWSGAPDCSDGAITMSTDISCTVTFDFCQGNPVRIGTTGYNSIGDAYGDEYTGAAMSGDTIEIIASNQQETLDFAKGKEVTLKGGNDCQFAPLPYSFTTITGSLTISTGSVTAHRIAIQ